MTARAADDAMLTSVASEPDVRAPARPVRGRLQTDTLLVHLTIVAFLVAWQVALVPTLDLSADNSWHFRLARDVVSGGPLMWAGVDANRLFPDLLFGVLAYVLPYGSRYATWIYYYHIIDLLALYGSLVAFARYLFAEPGRRRTFLVVATLAVCAYLVALPFWSFWLIVAGNHGAGLPVCFLCLALLFRMSRQGRADAAGALAFLVLGMLLVASNRLLLITFVAPLLLALVATFVLWPRPAIRDDLAAAPTPDPAPPLVAMIALTAVAGVGGYAAWLGLQALDWFELVALGGMPPIAFGLDWLAQALGKETLEFRTAMGTSFAWDVFIAAMIMLAAFVGGVVAVAFAVSRRLLLGESRNRVIYAVFTVLSVLLAVAFTIIKTDDSGTWHYRYVGVPSVFSIVLLSSLPFWHRRLALPRLALVGATLVAFSGLFAYALLIASRSTLPPTHTEVGYAKAVDQLAQMIARQANGAKPLRGYAEYWLANDLTTRSDELDVAILDSVKPVYRFYNNNPVDLCGGDRFFVAFSELKDEPKKADLLALLGEPRLVETMLLPRAGNVTVLYYDPAVIRERVTEPGRQTAVKLFPSFKCPS